MPKRKRNPHQRRLEKQIGLFALLVFIVVTALWLLQMMQPAPRSVEAPATPQPLPTTTPLSERLHPTTPPPVVMTTGCDVADLYDAVTVADHVVIDCAGPLILTRPLLLTHDISLSGANRQQAILSGANALDSLLQVEPAVTLTLFDIHLTEARTGVYLQSDAVLSAISCTLNYLGQPDGTTIANHGSRVYLRDCLLEHNSGASVLFNPQNGVLEMYDSLLRENPVNGESPLVNYGTLLIEDSIFQTNSGLNGGVIFNQGHLMILGSTFNENVATAAGGAIYNHRRGSATLRRSTFRDNTGGRGAAIYNAGSLTVEGLHLTSNRRDCVNLPGAELTDPQRVCQ
jgi:hypothetical protein